MAEHKKKKKHPQFGWAFAPLYGDGKGHSGATMPKNNVAPEDAHELPRGVNNGYPVDGQVAPNTPPAPAAPMGASADDEEDEIEGENMKEGLAGLNEDLDFVTRSFATPSLYRASDFEPNSLNGMTDVVMDDIAAMNLGLGEPVSAVGPVAPYLPDIIDPLAPLGCETGGCEPYMDPDEVIDDLPDLSGKPDAQDVLGAVLTILNAAMGF